VPVCRMRSYIHGDRLPSSNADQMCHDRIGRGRAPRTALGLVYNSFRPPVALVPDTDCVPFRARHRVRLIGCVDVLLAPLG
jgi:hypothetical protein